MKLNKVLDKLDRLPSQRGLGGYDACLELERINGEITRILPSLGKHRLEEFSYASDCVEKRVKERAAF